MVLCSRMVVRYMNTCNHFQLSKPLSQLPDIFFRKNTMADHLKRCSSLKELESLLVVMIKANTKQDCFVMNQFITTCFSFTSIDYATLAFTQMDNPNVFVYNALIRGFVLCFQPTRALQLYIHMLRKEVSPSSYTFSSLIKACTLASNVRCGESAHGHIWRNGFGSHVFVQTSLVEFYSNMGRIVESAQVFNEMCERDVFAWTTMVSAFARSGDLTSARRVFDMMPERSIAAWNTLINGYARFGDVNSAELLFNQIPAKDIISWTTMINCYVQNKKFREALEVFNKMTANGVNPDEVTMVTIISCCAHLGALGLGKEIHHYIMMNNFDLDVYLGSALIDMYSKCGNLDKSLLLFLKLREKNLFCWNSVIEGLAVHGYANEALKMFSKMEREKIKPNEITFISVLSACCHAGLVDEGHKRFQNMTSDYAIHPRVEHYGCMVDLLSKAGLLEEALELIRTMNCEPNAVIWGALLGGCKLHKNLDIARVSINELIVLEPNNSGYYAALINMLAEINWWADAARIRTIMRVQGIEKGCPGSSWIELENNVHQFAASDESHPDSNDIYALLVELDGELKLSGYSPDFGQFYSS